MRVYKALRFFLWVSAYAAMAAASWAFLGWTNRRAHVQVISQLAHSAAQRVAKVLGIRIRLEKTLTASARFDGALIVANHRSYLDILALCQLMPMRFVSKSEVRAWPVVGVWALLFGCLFCRRDSPRHSHASLADIVEALRQGSRLAVFPEGTSSVGPGILPFSPMFFEAAVLAQAPVLPMRLEYVAANGRPLNEATRDRVCWHGDQTFLDHFWSLLEFQSIDAVIRMGELLEPGNHRKELCRAAHFAVASSGTVPDFLFSPHASLCHHGGL